METVGLRELRQSASEIIREVEAGHETIVTVAGRPVARIVPITPRQWVPRSRAVMVWHSPTDTDWDTERRTFGTLDLEDPWDR